MFTGGFHLGLIPSTYGSKEVFQHSEKRRKVYNRNINEERPINRSRNKGETNARNMNLLYEKHPSLRINRLNMWNLHRGSEWRIQGG